MKKLLILMVMLLGMTLLMSQAFEYSFTQSSETYTEITGGTVVVTGLQDDTQYAVTPPFAFNFNFIPVTAMAMSTNGYVSFNAGISSFSYAAISSSTAGLGVVAPLSRDLRGGTLGEMRWEVLGLAPNRELVFQWKNWRDYSGSADDSWNFQVILYETSNDIAIRYGAFTWAGTYTNNYQVGLRGANNADFKNRTTTTDWSATTAGATNIATCTVSTTVFPASGLQFLFGEPVATTVPNPAVLAAPANGGWAFLDQVLSWTSGGGLPDAYDVYFDTVDGSTLVSDDQAGTTYTPTLAAGTTYYWKVIPSNAIGEATGCPVWSFSTPSATQLAESFENITFPPTGWANPGTWTRSTAVYKHGIASAYKYASTTTQYILSGPKVTLDGSSFLNFWSRSGSTAGTLQIVWSPDRVTWTQVGANITYPVINTLYESTVDLSSLAGNDYYIGFRTGLTAATSYYLDAIIGPELTAEVPNPVTLVAPLDLAVDQNPYATFTWTAATTGGVPTGYRVYCDTNPTPTTVVADVTGLTATLTVPLAFNTMYYWTVEAYNVTGAATTPTPRSFTTWADPTVTTFPWVASFEGTTFAPIGWTNVKTAGTSTPGIWDRVLTGTSPTCTPQDGTAMARYNMYSISSGGKAELITPPLAIPDGEDYRVKFWMYRDNGYLGFEEGLNVYVNTSPTSVGGTLLGNIHRESTMSPAEAVPNMWYEYSFAFSGTVAYKYLVFEGYSAYGNNLFLDNIQVEYVPPTPLLFLNPLSWDFGAVTVGNIVTKDFTLRNDGGGVLGITDIAITGDAEYTLTANPAPVSLPAGISAIFTVQYAPTTVGANTATVVVTDDLGARTITPVDLTGAGSLTVNMTTGSTNMNEGDVYAFYDSGGPSGTYSVSEDYTYTFYPPAMYLVHYAFSAFNTETGYDGMEIHNGPSIASPSIGYYEGTVLPPSFTSTDASGAITFHFTSDSSVQYDGWVASITLEPVPVVPVFQYNPTSLAFSTPVNTSSGWQNVTVGNGGAGTLTLLATDVALIGTDAALFEFDATVFPFNLANGQTANIPVRFSPLVEGPYVATLQMTYDAVPYDVALTGEATPEGLVEIGAGTNVVPMLPINAFYGYTYSQSIYLQSELNISGQLISKVSYYWNGAAEGLLSNDWTIYMGHTATAAFATTSDWIPLANLTQVYTGTVTLPAVAGWVEIVLDTPFAYNNTDNLVVAVDENLGGYDSPYGQFYCTDVATNRSILYYSDSTNPDPAAPPIAMYLRLAHPNTRLQFLAPIEDRPDIPVLISPADLAVDMPSEGFEFTWAAGSGGGGGIAEGYYLSMSDDFERLFTEDALYNSGPLTGTSYNLPYAYTYNGTYYWSVYAYNTWGDSDPAAYYTFTIEGTPPVISVDPVSFSETLTLPAEITSTQPLTIYNTGEQTLEYKFGFIETTARSSSITPPDQAVRAARTAHQARNVERTNFTGSVTEITSRDLFDPQFDYTFGGAGEYAIATDGTYLYTSFWATAGLFGKYDLDGTYLGTFTVPGAGQVRDLAFDGTYFYGGAASTTIYKMDFTSNTLVGTITAPWAVRGIAIAPDNTLWIGGNWTTQLGHIDQTGAVLGTFTFAPGSISGLAYDDISGATPTLWAFSQTGTNLNELHQMDLTGALLQTFDVTTLYPDIITLGAIAGGLEISADVVPGTATLLCSSQGYAIIGLELCTTFTWVTPDPAIGTVAGGGSAPIDINFDDTNLDIGVYTGILRIANNSLAGALDIPVTLTVDGVYPAVFAIDPDVSLDYGDVEQLNPDTQVFTVTNTGGSSPSPIVIGVGDIYISGDAEGNFALDVTGLPVTLGHNESYEFSVIFTPQTLGAKTATLNVEDNLGARVVNSVALAGNGILEAIGQVVSLTANVVNVENVQLNWVLASGVAGVPGYINYDDGINDDGIGTGGAALFDVAARFESGFMYSYAGMVIEKIKFFPKSANTNYTLKVWTGANGTMTPTTLVYSEAVVAPVIDAWNEITLATPVPITGSEAVWIGYEVDCVVIDALTDMYYPAGCDAGPAVATYGDILAFGGVWESMFNSYALNYNWNIEAYVNDAPPAPILSMLNIPVVSPAPSRDSRRPRLASFSGNTSSNNRVIRGYNVYRDAVQINTGLVLTTSYLDMGLPSGIYSYTVEGVYFSANTVISDPAVVEVIIAPPLPLPFLEDWASGSLVTNYWTAGGANWMMNASMGNPLPTVQCGWSPQATNYDIPLTSYSFDGTDLPAINLKFDLFLDWFDDNTANFMSWDVWDGATWTTLGTVDAQVGGDIPWTTYESDISAYAVGNDFKIRFRAHGEDTFSFDYWYIDNVRLELPITTLDAPVVTISQTAGVVNLSWLAITGANSYLIYGSDDPYAADPWTLVDTIDLLTYDYLGTENYKFFKVVASTELP